MKHLKKLVGVLLAVVMVMALAVPAMAASTKGSITIKNPAVGETYSIYKIMSVSNYVKNETTGEETAVYTAEANWVGFLKNGAGAGYVSLDANNVVTWTADPADDGADVKAFVEAAMNYAKGQNMTPVKTLTAEEGKDVKFENLDFGYYLVDSSLGAVCSIDTVHSDTEIVDKNEKPTVEKEITSSSITGIENIKPGVEPNNSNTARLDEVISFQTTVHAQVGAENYVLYDTMSQGLKLTTGSVEVKVGETVLTAGVNDDYVLEEKADGSGFTITFNGDYLKTITAATDIVVTYTAVVTADAPIAVELVNDTYLKYGKDSETEHGKTTTKTYEFQLVKTDQAGKELDGAEFKLYKSGSTEPIQVVPVEGGGYRIAVAGDENTTDIIVAGTVKISGLENGTYELEEIKPPESYNKLEGRQSFKIEDANLEAESTKGQDAQGNEVTVWDGNVNVVNRQGNLLPSTGGIGTTIFYIAGGVLVLGAVIVLIAKRRVSVDDE